MVVDVNHLGKPSDKILLKFVTDASSQRFVGGSFKGALKNSSRQKEATSTEICCASSILVAVTVFKESAHYYVNVCMYVEGVSALTIFRSEPKALLP